MPETGKINPGMADIDLIDKSLDLNKTEKYHISIQIDLDGVSFCILDISRSIYVAFKKYTINKVKDTENLVDRIEKILSEDDLLTHSFRSSSLLYLTQKSTLVPASFFDEGKMKDFFEFNHALEELDELNFNFIQDIDAYNVFAIPTDVANLVYNKFRTVKFYHQATPFIKSVISGFGEPSGMHINLNRDFFDIIVKENDKLKFYNTFRFLNETDLLYFVMYVSTQLNINNKTILLTLCGEPSDKPVFFDALGKYFPNLSYFEPVYPLFGESFVRFDHHKFFNLFYLYNCES
jgi:hypothetical protein